jgi:hypothetical protein
MGALSAPIFFAPNKYFGGGDTMKIKEVISNTKQVLNVQPSLVKQQNRVGKVVAQMAASELAQEPTEMDKVLAMRQYGRMKKRTDKYYAERLRQQLARAELAAK